MRCAWDELIRILPIRYRGKVDKLGKEVLQELRLRQGKPPELVMALGNQSLDDTVTPEDISYVVNMASKYSPWAAATASEGYITAPGGHRIGLCGETVIKNGQVSGFRNVTSVCIRVARDFPGISMDLSKLKGNVLLLGPPGSGKTTLLRDLIRQRSKNRDTVAVIDERGELFPIGIDRGIHTDVLTGCKKSQGISMALRTLGATCIAVDEISQKEDCVALLEGGWCGVELLATAHASSVQDLKHREIYRPLWELGLFSHCVILRRDKSWRLERIDI